MAYPATSPYRVFLTYLLLMFYCFGAGMMNEFVEYRNAFRQPYSG